MARKIVAVWLLEAKLRVASPLSVGGTAGLQLARDGQDEPYVPASSLAGVLRALVRRGLDPGGAAAESAQDGASPTERSFGWTPAQGDGGHASHLRVADAKLTLSAAPEQRDGVRIERFSGAAEDGFLYAREVVPVGSTLELVVEVEVPDIIGDTDAERERARATARAADTLIPLLAERLAAEGLRVGGATSRGLGHLAVDGAVNTARLDLASLPDVAAWWAWRAGDRKEVWAKPRPAPRPTDHPWTGPADAEQRWRITVAWSPAGPIMVKSGAEGDRVRQLPLTGYDGQGWRALLPGSSVRGALRSHAERIAATLDDGGSATFRVVVDDLFGRAREKGEAVMRGLLQVEDCRHRLSLPAPPDGADLTPPEGYRVRARNAVDRWTGGALDSALFHVLEPGWEKKSAGWEPLELELDLHRLDGEDRRKRALALLWLLLRDLAEGQIPLGFATHRGMGAITVEQVTFAWPDAPRQAETLKPAQLSKPPEAWETTLKDWEHAWTAK